MDYRTLGRTGTKVSPLCLGAMMFGAWGNTDHDDSIRIIHRALDAGINFVDTADVYSAGESEEIVGKALKGHRDDVVRATKLGVPMDEDPNHRGGSRRWIIEEVENSLRRLGTDYIDLYQLHRPDPHTDIDETLAALTDLVQQGKVRYIGSSSFNAGQIVEAQWAARERRVGGFPTEQPPYSPPQRRAGAAAGALPPGAAAVLAADALGRARRPADRPAPRHGHPHLQPAGRRVAVGELVSRFPAHVAGPPAARRALRHVAAREPAQARSRRAAPEGRRRRRPLHDRVGHRLRGQPPSRDLGDHRPADHGAARQRASRRRLRARRRDAGPHRRDRHAGSDHQPRRHQLRRAGASTHPAPALTEGRRAVWRRVVAPEIATTANAHLLAPTAALPHSPGGAARVATRAPHASREQRVQDRPGASYATAVPRVAC